MTKKPTTSKPFDKMYKEVRQADELEALVNYSKVRIKLLPSHKIIYSYLLSIVNLYKIRGQTAILTNERICAETGIGLTTLKKTLL